MNKRARQYLGLFSAVVAHYVIHEGAHLVFALYTGTFRQIRFLGLGMQIDVYAQRMTDAQLGIFCLVGSVATALAAYGLVFGADRLLKSSSKMFKACMYYVTLALLVLDPLYLSVLCGFFGGGDMNGIALLMPESAARVLFGGLLLAHGVLFWRVVLPKYKKAFEKE